MKNATDPTFSFLRHTDSVPAAYYRACKRRIALSTAAARAEKAKDGATAADSPKGVGAISISFGRKGKRKRKSAWGARRAQSVSRSLRRALLMPQVNPGSRC